jgi:cytochrome b
MSELKSKIVVWDAPVRVFHWLLVLSFAGAYVTSESERWRLIHVTLGYTMGGLVAFRILWGLVGTRYARFSSFVRGPAAVVQYMRALFSGSPQHHVGHNPAGALAILLLLASSMAIVASGWAVYNEVGGSWLEEVHEVAGNFMLAVVGVHLAGVVVASKLHRENLARAMVTGSKEGAPGDSIQRVWGGVALVVVAVVLAFWWIQWKSAPTSTTAVVSIVSPFRA